MNIVDHHFLFERACYVFFQLPNDMENYMEYHVMGTVLQVRMKPNCIPTRFQCQADQRKQTSDTLDRSYIDKKHRKMLVTSSLKDLKEPKETSCGYSGT